MRLDTIEAAEFLSVTPAGSRAAAKVMTAGMQVATARTRTRDRPHPRPPATCGNLVRTADHLQDPARPSNPARTV